MTKHSRISLGIYAKHILSQIFTDTRYMLSVYDLIIDEVIADIEECADEKFNNSDISLAIQRVLMKKLNLDC